jgi:hypothetical protein
MIGLFAAGLVLLNPPILNLVGGTLFGWPALYLYLFGVWAVLILVTALIVERSGGSAARDKDGDRR